MKELFNGDNNTENIYLEGSVETDEEVYKKLRNKVKKCYENNNINEELVRELIRHNEQVESFVEVYSEKEKFDDRQKEIVILAAILHDITKGWGDFLDHGKEGGEIAEKILKEIGVSDELAKSVKLAIERHMGPEGYPTDLAKKSRGNNFEYPKYETIVGQLVYECDILTQLTNHGIDKILLLRKNDSENIKEDEARSKKESISIEEVRIKSALESTKKSYDLIKINSIKERATEFWNDIEKKYKDTLLLINKRDEN